MSLVSIVLIKRYVIHHRLYGFYAMRRVPINRIAKMLNHMILQITF